LFDPALTAFFDRQRLAQLYDRAGDQWLKIQGLHMNVIRRFRNLIIIACLGVVILVTPPNAEKYGDRLQIALPLLALGCNVATGGAGDYAVRFFSMLFTVHASKNILGDAEINQRPRGGGHGFPSAHTAAATIGASNLVHECIGNSPVTKIAVVLTAAFVGTSRVDAGAHTIWQVLVGAMWALLFDRAFRNIRLRETSIGRACSRGLRSLSVRLRGKLK
jgi:membrane-associated phospholipid phosphatase